MKKQLFFMAMLLAMSLSASAQQLLPYQNANLSAEAEPMICFPVLPWKRRRS